MIIKFQEEWQWHDKEYKKNPENTAKFTKQYIETQHWATWHHSITGLNVGALVG